MLLTESYRHAETGVIAPFEYVSMLLALVLGYAVFGELPTPSMLVGAALIVAAGLFIIWRERRLGIQRRRAQGDDAPGLTAAPTVGFRQGRGSILLSTRCSARRNGPNSTPRAKAPARRSTVPTAMSTSRPPASSPSTLSPPLRRTRPG